MPASTLYLGPIGRLYEFEKPAPGWTSNLDELMSERQSLNGTRTYYSFGFKGEWSMELPYSTPLDERWLRQCHTGAVGPGDLWFIDPTVPNLLPRGVADTGAVTSGRAVRQFFSDAALAISSASLSDGWAPQSSIATSGVYIGGPFIPVIEGEQFTASAFTLATPIQTKIQWYDAAGTYLGSNAGTTDPRRASVTANAPSTAAKANLIVSQPDRSPSVATTAWQFQFGGLTEWGPGGGASRVKITKTPRTTPRYGLVTTSLEMKEL